MSTEQPRDALTIAVTGSHGMVGGALVPHLENLGHTVRPVVRRRDPGEGRIGWLPEEQWIDAPALEGVDAVVHLAGEPIQGRWNAAKKQRIRESRINGTRLLAETLASLDDKPSVLISASAIGYYGSRGDEVLTEQSDQGRGLLAEVAGQWEAAANPASEAGIRLAHPRFGMVLSPTGGALKQMLPIFRAGTGGRLGHGRQWVSWVTLDDAFGAIHHAITDPSLIGPFNVVAPEPLTNSAFVKTLARVLNRPAALPAPAFMLRLTVGDLADEALLASQRVQPAALETHGYQFHDPHLEPALRRLLARETHAPATA